MNKFARALFTLVLITLLIGCSVDLSDDQHVERAQGYLEQSEWEAAFIELKNALQQNRDNAMARWLLGKLHLEIGNYEAAEKELTRASELGVVDGSILPYLAQALSFQQKTDELRQLSLENISDSDQKAIVLAAQGLGELVRGRFDEATRLIDRALSLDLKSVYAHVSKARLLSAKQEYELARKHLDQVFALDARYASAWSLLGDLEVGNKNLKEADEAYTKAIGYRFNNFSDRLKRASVRIESGKLVEAQKELDELKQRAPEHSGVNYAQGLVHLHGKRLPEAQEAFELAISFNDRHLLAIYYLSLTHLLQQKWEQAESYGNQFLAAMPNSIQGRKLMATIKLQNQQYEEAEKLLRPVVVFKDDDVQALNLFADVLLKQGKSDQAADFLRKVVDQDPESAIAQFRLGVGLVADGKRDDGIAHVEKALALDLELEQAEVFLILNDMVQKQYGKAIKAAEAYRNRYSGKPAPYVLLGRLHLVMERELKAEEAFQQARKISPGDPAAGQGLASMAAKKKDYGQARSYLQEVLNKHENHLDTLLHLATLDALEGKEQQMIDHLQQAITAHPSAVQPRILLAHHYVTRGKPEQVFLLINELSTQQRNSAPALEVLALSELEQSQFSEAKVNLERLIDIEPTSVQAHFLLAHAYAGLNNSYRTKGELERALELEPKHFSARLALARLLFLERKTEVLDDQLAILDKMSPDHPDILRLKAAIAHKQGDQTVASELLEQVFERFPTTQSMLAAAQQKWSIGDRNGALLIQEQWVMENPTDFTSAIALASAYSKENRINEAIAQYEEVLKKDKKNVFALNELAWYLRDNQPVKALQYAQRASEIEPESPDVLDTLAVVVLRNGDTELAKRTIERALMKDPGNPTFLYHSAMIDAATGNREGALETLNALLSVDIRFSGRDEAKQLYKELQPGG